MKWALPGWEGNAHRQAAAAKQDEIEIGKFKG
jgi:hypothetical protein